MKKSEDGCGQSKEHLAVPLSAKVETLRRRKANSQFIASELFAFLKKHPGACVMSNINQLMEHLGKIPDSELMTLILDMLPSLGLKQDHHTCEIRFKAYVGERNFAAVQTLISHMRAEDIPITPRATFLIMKAALFAQNLDESLKYFQKLKDCWKVQQASEELVPQSIMLMFVELAWKEQRLGKLVSE